MSVIDIDKGMKKIKKEVEKFKRSYVAVGVLSKAGSYSKGEKANLADVATWNEFGVPSRNIPARPFMAQTFDRSKDQVRAMIEGAFKEITEGRGTANGALKKIGVYYVGQVKETFVKGEFVENSAYTKAKKEGKNKANKKKLKKVTNEKFKAGVKSSRPLIDTGRLRNSIDHEVKIL